MVNLEKEPSEKSLFFSFLQYFTEKFGQENPLYFFNQVSKEMLRLFSLKDKSNISFDVYILKLEFLLAWHFENNFYPRASIFELIPFLNASPHESTIPLYGFSFNLSNSCQFNISFNLNA